jgi:hypothetical protein
MERTPEPCRSWNEEHEPEPHRSRNNGGEHPHGEGSHRSRSQHREGPTCPLADLLPHHLVEEVEAEAGDPAPAQSLPTMAHAMQENVSSSTDLNTLAQNALAG